jgi:hypothetical protein
MGRVIGTPVWVRRRPVLVPEVEERREGELAVVCMPDMLIIIASGTEGLG